MSFITVDDANSILGSDFAPDSDKARLEPYRVCRRPLFLRECPDEKSKIHP